VPKAAPHFRKWTGKPPRDTYNGKPVLEFNGQPAFAELVILRTFEEVRWEGRWVDCCKHRYLTGYWPIVTKDLPQKQNIPDCESIRATANMGAASMCSAGATARFCSLNRNGTARMRSGQPNERGWKPRSIREFR